MGNCSDLDNNNQQVIRPKEVTLPGLQIVLRTWKQTYSNLFDFNALDENMNKKIIKITQNLKFAKIGEQYCVYKQNQSIQSKQKVSLIFSLSEDHKKDQYSQKIYNLAVNSAHQQSSKNQLWVAVKSLPKQKYCIKQGDILKLGKLKIRVKQIILENQQDKDIDQQIDAKFKVYDQLTKNSKGNNTTQFQCRICLDEGQFTNPLIAPCKCNGSSKYIHLKCLQSWLTKSLNPRTVNAATIITWKALKCELCSAQLPFKIYLDSTKHFTVIIPRPKRPYVILNPLVKENKQKSKKYYLISFSQKQKMTLGRKNECDIVLCDDATISRNHSSITYVKNLKKLSESRFYLCDNKSKFGTLIYVKNKIQLKAKLNGLLIQSGGDTIKVQYKPNHNLLYDEKSQNFNQSQEESEQQEDQQQLGQQESPNNNNNIQQNHQIEIANNQ